MSQAQVGFVLVTYNQPAQTLGLCRRLCDMFGDPPIAIHHDFSQTSLDRGEFPGSVRFVEDWRRTGWGSMSVVDGQMLAMQLLYEHDNTDWFTTLSSTDYPIQTADTILADLQNSPADVWLDSRRIEDMGQHFLNEGLGELAFEHPRYVQGAFNRYVALPLISPRLARRMKQPIEAWVVRPKWLIRQLTPFDGALSCYAGDFWITANRRMARFLLERTPLWERLYAHFARRSTPEEAFFHTLIGNSAGFTVSSYNRRYTDWRGCYAHPRVLGRADFPELLAATDHFARKFPYEPELLAELDVAVAAKAAAAVEEEVQGPW